MSAWALCNGQDRQGEPTNQTVGFKKYMLYLYSEMTMSMPRLCWRNTCLICVGKSEQTASQHLQKSTPLSFTWRMSDENNIGVNGGVGLGGRCLKACTAKIVHPINEKTCFSERQEIFLHFDVKLCLEWWFFFCRRINWIQDFRTIFKVLSTLAAMWHTQAHHNMRGSKKT